MYATQDDRQLGIAPAIVAVAVPTAEKLVKSILGGTPKQRQKKRVADYKAHYERAIKGDASAVDYLLGQSKGAATADAKKAALGYYNKAVAALAAQGKTVSNGETGTYSPPPVVAQASLLGGIPAPVLIGGGVLALILLMRRK